MISSVTVIRLSAMVMSISLLLMAPTLGHADPPTFPTTLSQGTSCQVWDIAGPITFVEDIPGVGTTTLTFVVATDDKGKITGTGALDATIDVPGIGTFVVDLDDPQAKGKVKSSRVGPPQLQIKSTLTGTTSGAGLVIPSKGKIKVKGEIDAAGNLQGTGSLQFKLAGQGAKSQGPLATGRIVDNLIAKGKFSANNDLSKVSLKNITGAKVQLKDLDADAGTQMLTGGSSKYSLMGQKKSFDVATGCP
jgi:hypothetical protein